MNCRRSKLGINNVVDAECVREAQIPNIKLQHFYARTVNKVRPLYCLAARFVRFCQLPLTTPNDKIVVCFVYFAVFFSTRFFHYVDASSSLVVPLVYYRIVVLIHRPHQIRNECIVCVRMCVWYILCAYIIEWISTKCELWLRVCVCVQMHWTIAGVHEPTNNILCTLK